MLINMFGIRIFDNKIIRSDDSYWETTQKVTGCLPHFIKGYAVPKDYVNDFGHATGFEMGISNYVKRTKPFEWY